MTPGESIIAGLQDAIAYAQGEQARGRTSMVRVPDYVDVKAIRQRLGLTQEEFASWYGFGVSAIRNWEQGRRRPEKTARILLTIIDREPDATRRALAL
jgi:putative transcriptional regulator